MAILENITQMKNQGKSEGEIIATLRSQGVNPLEISEALNQSKIKEAVYDSNPTEGMTPSMMETENRQEAPEIEEETSEEMYSPEPTYQQEPPQYQKQPLPPEQVFQGNYQQYNPPYEREPFSFDESMQNNYAPPEGYDDNSYGDSTDMMIEVAEQIFSEKMKKISKELHEIKEFKTLFETKIENFSNRLERMEKQFDKMQLSILEKVGEYGKGLNYLKKELNMVEDSISKINSKI